jgi:hypothetical protein
LRQKLGQHVDHGWFVTWISQEELARAEAVFAEVPQPDDKSHRATATREAGRLGIEEAGASKVHTAQCDLPRDLLQGCCRARVRQVQEC